MNERERSSKLIRDILAQWNSAYVLHAWMEVNARQFVCIINSQVTPSSQIVRPTVRPTDQPTDQPTNRPIDRPIGGRAVLVIDVISNTADYSAKLTANFDYFAINFGLFERPRLGRSPRAINAIKRGRDSLACEAFACHHFSITRHRSDRLSDKVTRN